VVEEVGFDEAVPRWQEAYDSSRGMYYYYCEEMQVRVAVQSGSTIHLAVQSGSTIRQYNLAVQTCSANRSHKQAVQSGSTSLVTAAT
jgi:hypothetical protein